MIINTTAKSFTSLNGAIKVTKIDNTNSSSKTLNDAVSVNISSNAISNTTSLLNSLKEETVIQSRNGYINPEEARQVKMLEDHYSKMNEENKMFANPYAHSSEKYYDIGSPYYIQGLSNKERDIASSAEISYLNGGELFSYEDAILKNEPLIYGDVDVAQRKAFDREKVNTQFQILLNKYNVTIPQDTKLSFTIDPNSLKATVSGTDDKTLATSVEDIINTADNAKQLFLHVMSSCSDDSIQYSEDAFSKFHITQKIKDETGYTLKDLEIKDGKFITPDGTDIAEIYEKKANEDPNIQASLESINKNLKKITKKIKQRVLTKDELMLIYLFGKSEKEKKEIENYHSLIDKLKKQDEQNKLNSTSLQN